MKRNLSFGTFLLMPLLLLLFTACTKEIKDAPPEENLSPASENSLIKNAAKSAAGNSVARKLESELLKSVRGATSRYNSTTQAILDGYQPDDHCVSVPGLGGMGYHWVNPSLVDPVFDPLKPEVVLYATAPNGKLRLVAVEYIVINVGQPRPMFGDQPFDINGTPVPAPHWSLHVWLYEENPRGMFVNFNPNISCP